ncbi:MAG: EamA family transporter [Anaerolineaceae bacterium]|nr:EamA family transporter [Anaerolineaceae bacterium]
MIARRLSNLPSTWRIIAGFAAIYLIWGSTYLGIRFAIETIPPFMMAGFRFVIAGAILYALSRRSGATTPTRIHWRGALVQGGLMFLIANGAIVQAEQVVPSGVAALMIATVPLWVALLGWVFFREGRPDLRLTLGLVIGLVGMGLLVIPGDFLSGEHIDPAGALLLLGSALAWSSGTLFSRRLPAPSTPLMGAALNMLTGGALLVVLSTITGEFAAFNPAAISARSLLAILYLIVFGSVVAFGSYMYLLSVVLPSRVTTYAYVNPVIAVFLGWLLGEESLTARTIVGTVVIVTAVVLITARRAPRRASSPTTAIETALPTPSISPLD